MNKRLAILAVGLCFCAAVAQAHHSVNGEFDRSNRVQVTGVVKEFFFVNPHVHVTVDVRTEAGDTEEWELWTTSNTKLSRILGWNRETLKPGDVITVDGSRGIDFVNSLWVDKIVRDDGTVLQPFERD